MAKIRVYDACDESNLRASDDFYPTSKSIVEQNAKWLSDFNNNAYFPNCPQEFLEPPRILDLGCGDGRYAQAMRHLYPNAEIVGMDIVHRSPQDLDEFIQIDILEYCSQVKFNFSDKKWDILKQKITADFGLFDYVIGNPPYSRLDTFIAFGHACVDWSKGTSGLGLLVPLEALSGQRKYERFFRHNHRRPFEVFVYTSRLDFTGGGANHFSSAFFQWRKGYMNEGTFMRFVEPHRQSDLFSWEIDNGNTEGDIPNCDQGCQASSEEGGTCCGGCGSNQRPTKEIPEAFHVK